MAEVLWKTAVPVERRRHSGIGACKGRRDGEPGLRAAHALIDILFVEDAVTAAQHGVILQAVGEAEAGREILEMSIKELRPTLAAAAVAAEDVCSRQPAGARVRDCGIHI